MQTIKNSDGEIPHPVLLESNINCLTTIGGIEGGLYLMELTDMFMPDNIYSHVNYASFSGTGLQKTVFRGKGFQRCEKGSNVNKQKIK